MLNDITDRVKAQEALAASETNYRNLFDHTLLGMEVVDGQTGKMVLANHAIARMFGFKSPEEMVGIDPTTFCRKTWNGCQEMAESWPTP